jgi:hypothetical protein
MMKLLKIWLFLLSVILWVGLSPLLSGESNVSAAYVDATASSGLRFLHRNSNTPEKYLIETMTGGVALIDYDGDGWEDVFFVNGAKIKDPQPDNEVLDKSAPEFWNRMFHNNRDGTFTDVTEKTGLRGKGYGMGAAVGDYDNDGHMDLFVSNFGQSILYRNNGDGTFTDVTAQSKLDVQGWACSAGFFDYNNDGYLDLFVTRYMVWNFSLNIHCGPKIPGGRAYCHPDNFKAISSYLLRNNGDGTFTDVTKISHIADSPGKGLGVAFADFNNDGFMDVEVANDQVQQFLFKNNGNGTFEEMAVLAGMGFTEDGKTFSGMGTDFVDLDNDGFPDIITTALSNESYAYFHNNGDESFTYATLITSLGEITRLLSGWGVHIFDYDNDGLKDLFIANGHVMDNIQNTQPHLHYMQKPSLLRNVNNKFVDVSDVSGPTFQQMWASRGAAFGDLDNDGDIDIVVSNCDGPSYFIRNEGGNRKNWIAVELRGVKSNRMGIGARVKLTSESGKVQYNMVSTTASYLSANDHRVFFGLGAEKKIKEIEVAWPGGHKQKVAEPRINELLKLEESVEKK